MSPHELAVFCHSYYLNFNHYEELRGVSLKKCWAWLIERERLDPEHLEEEKQRWGGLIKTLSPEIILTPDGSDYPECFRNLPQPPVFLTFAGDLGLLREKSLSVVGSRRAQPQFLAWMNRELGAALHEEPRVIVSGGAVGIDQRASEVGLYYGAGTIILVPAGLGQLYPVNLKRWLNEPRTLLLSEYLPNEMMQRHHFVKRNRLIAALSEQLLVVQCAIKSGSMITVKYALELGKHIGTIPDFPDCVESSGNLLLLKEGATPLHHRMDLGEFMRGNGDAMPISSRVKTKCLESKG